MASALWKGSRYLKCSWLVRIPEAFNCSHRLANHAFRGAPADQRDVGIGGSFELRRRQILQRQVHLLHALFGDLAPHGGVAENVADQHAFFIVVVGGRDVHRIGRAGKRARGNAGLGEFDIA